MIEFMYDALRSPHGIIVKSKSAERLRTKLYPLRKQDERFHELSFVLSPFNPTTELWIIRRVKPHAEDE